MTRGSARTVEVAAVDLGATSGRVMVGHVGPDELSLTQVARFPNGPVPRADGLHWDFDALRRQVWAGLRTAGASADIRSIGIDSWAVDYGLLSQGQVRGDPFHYRDARTAAGVATVHARMPFAQLYAMSGIQFLPFNTLYQLAVDHDAGRLADADTALLIPDLLAYLLTGSCVAERTNASATGLLDADGAWNDPLIGSLDLPRTIFPRLTDAGDTIGPLLPDVAHELGFDAPVTAVGSHDTASAVVAAPLTNPNAAYISCGTWGLVGVELDSPVLSAASRDANFTNERGVDGRIRYLRNVMGLWLLSESLRAWQAQGMTSTLPELLRGAAAITEPVAVFDVDDERFMAPGDMPARIAAHCREHGLPVPGTPAAVVRSILESLAAAFARAVRQASELSGKRVEIIHIVGGGAQNELLCRLTAGRAGLPVIAGPVEATALGNALVQARALGAITGTLEDLRELVARTAELYRYDPD